MDADLITWLSSPGGREAIRQADQLLGSLEESPGRGSAPLLAAQRLRALPSADGPPLTAPQAAAALTQVELAKRAGLEPGSWLLTRDGLEQATTPVVAARHAQHLGQLGAAVVELGAGLGFDTAAMVAAGLTVTALEADPVRAACLRANVPNAAVVFGDLMNSAILEQVLADPSVVIYADPGRRAAARQTDGRRAHPERDPQRWSPPWAFLVGLAARHRLAAKVAANIPETVIAQSWQVEWVSINGTLVEAFVTNGEPLAARRQAAVLRYGRWQTIPQGPAGTPGTSVQAFVHEVDPAVVAAAASTTLAARMNANLLTSDGRWLTSSELPTEGNASFLRSYAVVEQLPSQLPALRQALRARGISRATIKSRGRDQARLRHELRISEGTGPILAFIDGSGSDRKATNVLVLEQR